MIDLSRENLIPLKTMAKTRDGRNAIFINGEVDRYRFITGGTSEGSFTVKRDGNQNSIEGKNDIVSLGKPWHPKDGERVSVLGYGEHT